MIYQFLLSPDFEHLGMKDIKIDRYELQPIEGPGKALPVPYKLHHATEQHCDSLMSSLLYTKSNHYYHSHHVYLFG